MFYTHDLEGLVFQQHTNLESVDELVVLSGYLGPDPVSKLESLPFRSTVIYGMYGSEKIRPLLHSALTNIQSNSQHRLNILYSNIPVHSKCYLWKNNSIPVHALVGSANFSVNGLTTPYREILVDAPSNILSTLNDYVDLVISRSISCIGAPTSGVPIRIISTTNCLLSLLMRNGQTHNAGGLNWGQNPSNHTTLNDAYIPISTQHISTFPNLFPPKQMVSMSTPGLGRTQRHNDYIEIIWDDGRTMRGLLEGSQTVNGIVYPKQISSFPVKGELGLYLRNRLGVSSGDRVTSQHLLNYGRTDIEVNLIQEGIYSFNFSNT